MPIQVPKDEEGVSYPNRSPVGRSTDGTRKLSTEIGERFRARKAVRIGRQEARGIPATAPIDGKPPEATEKRRQRLEERRQAGTPAPPEDPDVKKLREEAELLRREADEAAASLARRTS
jgi:hypothetical protein